MEENGFRNSGNLCRFRSCYLYYRHALEPCIDRTFILLLLAVDGDSSPFELLSC
jgi:hypothetical protein